jgi:hypothetical protein
MSQNQFGYSVQTHALAGPFLQWLSQQVQPVMAVTLDDIAIVDAVLNGRSMTLQGWGTGIPDAYAGRDAALRLYSLATYAGYHAAAEVLHDLYAFIDDAMCSR